MSNVGIDVLSAGAVLLFCGIWESRVRREEPGVRGSAYDKWGIECGAVCMVVRSNIELNYIFINISQH